MNYNLDGILIVNKPQEMTSFDVIAILRRKLGIKRIGHLGTLDPMATGVLPVAIGKAARIMDYLDGDIKEYTSEFTFGINTDTDDIWGNIIEERDPSKLSESDIQIAVDSFRGIIDQKPPVYSALKVNGKKLYQYARSGEDVEIKSRKIYIESISLLSFDEIDGMKKAVLRIRCSKGTYIRSIARDLGIMLNTACTMSGLIRNSSGDFSLADSTDIEEIKKLSPDDLEKRIKKMDFALKKFPQVRLGEWESKLFKSGVTLREDQWIKETQDDYLEESYAIETIMKFPLNLPDYYHDLVRVYGEEFIGMGIVKTTGELKAHKVLI